MNPDAARAAPFVVAVAASAGGLEAITALLAVLPAGLPAAVLVVLHLSPNHPSYLAEILGRRTPFVVKGAEEGERLRVGTVYCASPDFHLLVKEGGTLTLSHAARTQHVRPSADRLFDSVAAAYGPRALAAVLSGTGRDGARGVVAVHAAGGLVLAQDESAEYCGMPEAAIRTGVVDEVLPLGGIAAAVEAFVVGPGHRSDSSVDPDIDQGRGDA